MKLRLLITTAAAVCLASTPSVQAGEYFFRRIDVPGARDTEILDINNHGQVTGLYYDQDGFSHSFVYGSGGFTTIAPPPGNGFFGARAINDAGQVLGHADIGGNFLFDGASWTPVPNVPGAIATIANGLNNLGHITGYYIPAAGEPSRGFLLKDGVFTTFAAPGAVDGTVGLSLNDSDQIVGYFGTGTASPPTQYQAFLNEDGEFTDFEKPGVGINFANDINNRGQVVGTYRDLTYPWIGHSFLYDAGILTEFSAGSLAVEARGINDLGQIAGWYVDEAGGTHGFIATLVPEPASVATAGIAAGIGLVVAWRRSRGVSATSVPDVPRDRTPL